MSTQDILRLRTEMAFLAPPSFDLEATNLCNLRCRFCPREELTRPKGMMAEATLERILDHIPPDSDVYFCGFGEPLLHPRLATFVRRAKERGRHRVSIVTNGTLLASEKTRRLIDAGLDTLKVSFNGITPEVYESLMVGARFGEVVARVEEALALCGRRTRVEILFTDTAINHAQKAGLIEFWRARGAAEVVVTSCHNRGGALRDEELYQIQTPPPDEGCGIFALVTFVTWTGEVLSCCEDIKGANPLGNLTEVGFEEIVHRKQAIVREGRWYPICATCDTEVRYNMLQLRRRRPAPAREPEIRPADELNPAEGSARKGPPA